MFKQIKKNLLTKYHTAREKIKNFYAPIFDPEKRKKGFALVAGLVILGVLGVVTAGVKYISFKGDEFTNGMIKAGGLLFLKVATSIFQIPSSLLQYVLGSGSIPGQAITTEAIFTAQWANVRNMANMLIVLGFVIVGIATALRLREYEAKKLLPKLILIALLINFSGLFCGLIIDASNITMKGLLINGGGTTIFANISSAMNTYVENKTPSISIEDAIKYASECIGIGVFELIGGFIFFTLALLLFARYAVLAALYIISPIAFVFWIFPPTKKLWTEWWDNFIKWSFMGVSIAFFISLAASTLKAYANAHNDEVDLSVLMVALVFLFVGYKLTTKAAPMVSKAVMGLATGAAGFAVGAIGAVGGFAANATGATRGINALKTGGLKTLEAMRLVAPGTANSMEAKRLEEPKKRLASMSSKQLAEVATRKTAWSKQGSEDRAAAGLLLAERKDLHEIKDDATREKVMMHSISFPGAKRSDFGKADYLMAELDPQRRQKVMTDRGLTGAAGETAARRIIRSEQIQQNLQAGMTTPQYQNIAPADMAGPDGYDRLKRYFNETTIVNHMQTAPSRLRAEISAHVPALNSDIATATTPNEREKLTKLRDSITIYL